MVPLKFLDTKAVTDQLERMFQTHGLPECIRTDGGLQFRSEFRDWCQTWGIQPIKSSPNHPQSNGHAEQAVRQMKDLLKRTPGHSLGQALLELKTLQGSQMALAQRNGFWDADKGHYFRPQKASAQG